MTNVIALIRNKLSNPSYRQFIKFAFVGVINTAIFYGVYYMMIRLGIFYIIAVTAGTVVGIVNSYILNKFFTFKSRRKNVSEMAKFVTVYGIQYVSNIVVIHLCITYFGISAELAVLPAIGIGVIISFFGHKLWSFR